MQEYADVLAQVFQLSRLSPTLPSTSNHFELLQSASGYLHHMPLLIHFDRIDAAVVALIVVLGDGALEGLVHFPQTVLEEAGTVYTRVAPNDPLVVVDGKLVTGQNQQSASEYALVLLHAMTGSSPVAGA